MEKNGQKIFFAANIKFLRERLKINQEELAKKLGITRAKLAALETGNTKAPQPEDYVNFSELFKISIDTLLKVDLSKLGELKLRELEAGNDVYIKGGNLRVLAISVDKSNNENVEYVPIKAKAGYIAGYNDPEYISSLPKAYIPSLPSDGTYRIFPITGDSMLPVPDHSDVTARYVPDWTTLKPDTPCIVVIKGQDFVFKLVSFDGKGNIVCSSLNQQFLPFIIPVEEVLEIWQFHSFTTTLFPQVESDLKTLSRKIDEIRNDLLLIKK